MTIEKFKADDVKKDKVDLERRLQKGMRTRSGKNVGTLGNQKFDFLLWILNLGQESLLDVEAIDMYPGGCVYFLGLPSHPSKAIEAPVSATNFSIRENTTRELEK